MLKLFCLVTFFCQNLHSNSIGNRLFQLHKILQDEHPCWSGLTQNEYKDLKDLISKNKPSCDSITTPKTNIKELWQQFVFDLAREKYSNRIQCIKKAISFLQNKDKNPSNSNIYKKWLGGTASNLAQYFAYHDLKLRLFNQAHEETRRLPYRSSIRIEDDEVFNEKYQSIQKLLQESDKFGEDADKAIARIPFFGNQNFSDQLITLTRNKLKKNSIQNNYCKYHSFDRNESSCDKENKSAATSNKTSESSADSEVEILEQNLELKLEIAEILKDISTTLFNSSMKQLENDASLNKSKWDAYNNGTQNDNQFLWERGLVFEVLEDLFPQDSSSASQLAVKSKLKNCIEGEYGTLSSGLNSVKSGFFYIFGGKLFLSEKLGYSWIKKLVETTPSLTLTKIKIIAGATNAKNWILGDVALIGADLSADAIYKKCIKKYPEYGLIKVPNNCSDQNDTIVNDFAFKSLGLMSCMAELRAAVIGI